MTASDAEILVGLLAVGLVVVTAGAVAVVAHALTGLPWPAALVLGAVVSPTDPVSATAIIRRLGVSGRIATILEGESLVNDGTALVLYRLGIAATVAGALSPTRAFAQFVWVSVGGVLTGALAARLVAVVRRWITVSEVEITLSLIMPFVAYLPAERIGVSGVLAAVTAGLLVGRQPPLTSAGTRLRRHAFWEVLAFLLNSTLFLLIGLAFLDVLHRLHGATAVDLASEVALVAATVMGLRFLWMLLVTRVPNALRRSRGDRLPRGELLVLGWSGMGGGVSLAAALAVPVAAGGESFPGRAEIIFVTYVVVLATLVVPGLTLGPLIGRLGIAAGEAQRARAHIAHAAIEHLDELARNDDLPHEVAERLRELYTSRVDGRAPASADTVSPEPYSALAHARRAGVAAQRAALTELELQHRIGPAAAREIEQQLDLEERLCT
jgi:monovalent cation/hydrogen antiporter